MATDEKDNFNVSWGKELNYSQKLFFQSLYQIICFSYYYQIINILITDISYPIPNLQRIRSTL